MDNVTSEIYPEELSLTSDDAVLQTHYLDLDLEIRNNKIHSKLFDKRDAFGFSIVNFPYLSGNIPKKQSYVWRVCFTNDSLCTLLHGY